MGRQAKQATIGVNKTKVFPKWVQHVSPPFIICRQFGVDPPRVQTRLFSFVFPVTNGREGRPGQPLWGNFENFFLVLFLVSFFLLFLWNNLFSTTFFIFVFQCTLNYNTNFFFSFLAFFTWKGLRFCFNLWSQLYLFSEAIDGWQLFGKLACGALWNLILALGCWQSSQISSLSLRAN